MLRSELADISKTRLTYRRPFEAAPNDKLSVAFFDSGQEGSGLARAVLLQKPIGLPLAAVVALLWSRAFVFIEEWDKNTSMNLAQVWEYALDGDYMRTEFAKFVTQGTFDPIAPSVGRDKITDLLRHLRFDSLTKKDTLFKSYTEHCSGLIKSPGMFRARLTDFEFVIALRTTDLWNDQTFFFETQTDFGYFSWGTSA